MLYNWISLAEKSMPLYWLRFQEKLRRKRRREGERETWGNTGLSYWFSSIFKPRKLFNMWKIFDCYICVYASHDSMVFYVDWVCVYNLKRIFCSWFTMDLLTYRSSERGEMNWLNFYWPLQIQLSYLFFSSWDLQLCCVKLCKFCLFEMYFKHTW